MQISVSMIQNAPLHTWHPDWGVVINLLGVAVHRCGLRITQRAFLESNVPSPRYQDRYWQQWHQEVNIRREALRQRDGWSTVLDSIGRMNAIIDLCPATWVREIARITPDRTRQDLSKPGFWIYCAYHPMYGLRYWGQTGAKESFQAVAERFYDEIKDAQRWQQAYGKKGVRGPPYIHTLDHTRVEHWLVIPICQVRPSMADRVEQWYIIHYSRKLNSKGSTAHKHMRYLVRSRLYRHLTDTALQDHTLWMNLISNKRINMDPMDCLTVITTSKRVLAPHHHTMLKRRLLDCVHHKTGLYLPATLPLRIPYCTRNMRRRVKQAWYQFLSEVPYPEPIRKYLGCTLTVVGTLPGKAQDVWCEDRVIHSMRAIAQMLQNPATVCGCVQLPTHTGPCAHMSIHTADERTQVFGKEWAPLVHMGPRQSVVPAKGTLHETITAELQVLREALPKKRQFRFNTFSCSVHRIIEEGIPHTEHAHTPHPANITATRVKRFKQTWPRWKPIRLDKNISCYTLVCWHLYLILTFKTFDASPNYTLFHRAASAKVVQDILLIYYFLWAVTVPALGRQCNMRTLRSTLTGHVPILKGARIPYGSAKNPWDHDSMGGGQGDMTTWEAMRDDIFDIAKHLYAQCCLQHTHLHLPNGQQVYGRPKRRTWKVPSVRVSAKNKCMPHQLDSAKTSEIFTQVGHMFTTALKKCGRVQNVLLHKYMNTFTTLEIVDQRHLVTGFLQPAQELYRSKNITPVAFEFDVERMYPNISRDRVVPAYRDLDARVKKLEGTLRPDQDTCISVAKGKGRKLDSMGHKGLRHFDVFTMPDFLEILATDLYMNDFVGMGDEVWRQATGVAIGGFLSAANADIVLMHAESTVGCGTTFPEGISLARFRDNVFGFCPADEAHYWLPKINQFLEGIYHLPLTYETMGISVTISGTNIHWGLKNKKLLSTLSEAPEVQRYPHKQDPGAERTVKGLATNLGGKAVTIASSGMKVQENFAHIVWQFQQAGYPADWWRPVLRNA